MATNPSTLPENSGRITAPDANYPYGSAKDDSTGTTGDGTPIKKALLNDTYGIIQAILRAVGTVPSGNAENATESQVLQAINGLASGASNTYDVTGVANAYVLELRPNQQKQPALFDGMGVAFTLLGANTGAASIDVSAILGGAPGTTVKSVTLDTGAALSGGELDGLTFLTYSLSGDRFERVSSKASATQYDSTASGLAATDVQAAIDEVALSLFASGQTWQDVRGSRSAGVTYTNTTDRPIMVSATATTSGNHVITVDGVVADGSSSGVQAVVPAGGQYVVTLPAAGLYWSELR